jgi:hypothetical protein
MSWVQFLMVLREFFIGIILLTAASQRNEYQEYSLRGTGGWCIGLTTLKPSCANCLEIWEPQCPGTLRSCTGVILPLSLVKICS